jgi:uncharacterized protein involved in exopolysaccharide biosynthesis
MDKLARKDAVVERVPRAPIHEQELTIADLFLILRRRRTQIAITTGVFLLLGVIACLLTTPKFEGKAVLEIPKTSADMLDVQNMMAGATPDGPSDALDANLDLQTEAEILQSDALALKVIEELHLDKTRDFQPKQSLNPIALVMRLFPSSSTPDATGASLEDSPQRRTSALNVFAAHLKVEPVAGTRLI